MSAERIVIVVPCYNEEARLDAGAFLSLAANDAIELLFVDDGSSDGTARRLEDVSRQAPLRITSLSLASNRGKAEAVREGLRAALATGAGFVGYVDADLATPAPEIARLASLLRDETLDILIASRVALLGKRIERRPARHYLGRAFATAASIVLKLTVYDTQCGAKYFRRTPALEAALAEPFLSRWLFDVELLGRLTIGTPTAAPVNSDRIREEPLREWRDVAGSKLHASHMLAALVDLARISGDLSRRRQVVAAARR